MSKLVLIEQSVSPTTPSTTKLVIYAKTDGKVYAKNDAGVEYDLTSSGGGGGGEDLAATLALGNTTGGTNLVISDGDQIVGESGSGVAGDLVLRAGGDTGAGPTDGGSVILRPGPSAGLATPGAISFVDPSVTNTVSAGVLGAPTYPAPTLRSVGTGTLGMTLGPLVAKLASHTFTAPGETYQMLNNTACVLITCTSPFVNCTVALPTSPVPGQVVTIKDVTPAGRADFTIGGGTIDGAAGKLVTGAYWLGYTMIYNGANWFII